MVSMRYGGGGGGGGGAGIGGNALPTSEVLML